MRRISAKQVIDLTEDVPIVVPDNLNVVTEAIANGPKRSDGLCVSYDCAYDVMDDEWEFAECQQCRKRREKLDAARLPFIRGTVDAGLTPLSETTGKRSHRSKAYHAEKAAATAVTNVPPPPPVCVFIISVFCVLTSADSIAVSTISVPSDAITRLPTTF